MYSTQYIEKNLTYLNKVAQFSQDYEGYIFIGYIDKNYGPGKPFQNMAAVLHKGLIIARYAKQLLPFYDVFDEGRYFEPGNKPTILNLFGRKIGICICEDLWNDKEADDYNYHSNPVQEYRKLGADTIISLNSSPFVVGKQYKREKIGKGITVPSGIDTLIYVNQIGSQDELIFDGNSFVSHLGYICYPENNIVDVPYGLTPLRYQNPYNKYSMEQIKEALYIGTKGYIKKNKFRSVVVGSSGGIDSAVTIALASDALGSHNVAGIRMPSVNSSSLSTSIAKELHIRCGCADYLVPINYEENLSYINERLHLGTNYNHIADQNIQARMRSQILMHYSNATGSLVLTTGNKTELALGYCTLGGDMLGGFGLISDLYKLEVKELASFFGNIPQEIIDREPTAELAIGQSDEKDLLPYRYLDLIVEDYIEYYVDSYDEFIDRNLDVDGIKDAVSREDYVKFIRRINDMEYKRCQKPIGLKIHKISFGAGRRIPITKNSNYI